MICSEIDCSDHFLTNAQSNHGHAVAVDVERSELYCFLCNNQVYDLECDRFVEIKRRRSRKRRNLERGSKRELEQ